MMYIVLGLRIHYWTVPIPLAITCMGSCYKMNLKMLSSTAKVCSTVYYKGIKADEFVIMLPFICVTLADCDEGDVRLLDGTDDSNGRVEVCHNGMWTSMCSSEYDQNIASVVCKQLGYNSTKGTFKRTLFTKLANTIKKQRYFYTSLNIALNMIQDFQRNFVATKA